MTMKPSALALISLLLISGESFAHHSYQLKFDNTKEITLSGVIKEVSWGNPHIEYILEVSNEIGAETEVELWSIPTAAPGVARSNNLSSNSIQIGDSVTFSGWPARNGSESMRALEVVLEDGNIFRLRPNRGPKRSR
jgi:hypothetical protein